MSSKTLLLAFLVTIWGVRLTYNFARRGAYHWKFWSGEEDYRWAVLRQKPELKGRFRWTLFNLFFICIYQNALILLFTLPILLTVGQSQTNFMWSDYVFTLLFLLLVILETIADQQQWEFQSEKHRRINLGLELGDKYSKGFTHSGLWKYVRHPNYTCEQAIWICYYLLASNSTGQWINWSISGSLLLLLLFQGSSDFSESISAEKYPDYKNYQKSTGRFLPKINY